MVLTHAFVVSCMHLIDVDNDNNNVYRQFIRSTTMHSNDRSILAVMNHMSYFDMRYIVEDR